MQDITINVPRLDWLIGGKRIGGKYNRYYGSCGTDPNKGLFESKIFNYSVWIEEQDEQEVICAACHGGFKSFENTDGNEIEKNVYPLEEDSREEIHSWLTQKAEIYFSQNP